MTQQTSQHHLDHGEQDDLLARHNRFLTDSAAAACRQTILFERQDFLEPLDRAEPFRMSINSVLLDDVRISAVRTSGHRVRLVEDENITLLLPWTGTIETDDIGRRIEARTESMLIPTPGPRTTICEPGYLGLVVQLPLTRLRSAAALNPDDRWRPDGQAPGVVSATAGQGAALSRYLRHLASELDQSDALLVARGAAKAATMMVTELLGAAWQAATVGSEAHPRSAGRYQVEIAEEIMRAKSGDPLSITALAARVGVSTRSLQLAFRQYRGMGPRQILEDFRLDAAHARLFAAAPGDNVTRIALDCGVTHLGRFATRYRARFGETPLATLRRRRS
ncbi:helix-turn-helix transcriptional regulator [Bosea sp. (in: a-proteobacteria)]|uniref:Helix-turn-helix transcriptional regulator n=1 Tax=Bosea vestrisii TaxID=151416 RepID=A0ABW0H8J2_9HYPH|nr:helix-turn-helix transcriptional regulator [Bosea sp. (in: a-proteobacteria)]MBR3192102.1 AraC family transcriptional regulator [Bosea sp. (in: a-proteobacteria)]